MAVGGVGPTDAHSPHLNVHIKDVREEHSSSTIVLEEETNGHETLLPIEGQLLQMLASFKSNWKSNRWRRCVNTRRLL